MSVHIDQSLDTAPDRSEGEGDNSHSRKRGAQVVSSAHSAQSEPRKLSYKVAHSVPGRLRIKVADLRFDPDAAGACILTLAATDGVIGVGYNKWCASVVIQYDANRCSETELLHRIDQLSYSSHVTAESRAQTTSEAQAGAAPERLPWKLEVGTLVPIARSTLRLIQTATPPLVQLLLGAAAFASALFRWPIVATRILVAASTVPIACRAVKTLADEKKLGVDALDGAAAALLISSGKFIEAGFMTVLIGLGEFIREKTARRCQKLVTDLLGMTGRSAWLIKGDKRVCVPADEVKKGDTVVVYPGDMVPVDGTVLQGEAAIDQSSLTGESLPVEVQAGSSVLASSVLVEGKIYVRCQATGLETKAGLVLQ
ncbi:MAG: HMA2 domain-containing protein, partial [Terriglobales bacterium]